MNNLDKNIRKIEPYVPGDQPDFSDMIKINTNENPYPPSPMVDSVIKNFASDKLRLYPDPNSTALVKKIAQIHGVQEDMVITGVGSDDVLAIAFMTFFNSGKPIVFPDITYSFYDVWANLYNIKYIQPKLDENFKINAEDYKNENGGVVIANPNAPTGVYENMDFIEDIIKANQDVVVIIDEAYVDFAGESAISLLDKYDNLVVVRTFSKSHSMAGMRIGYAVGSSYLIKAMNDIRYSINSYPLTRVSVEAGVAALEDEKYFNETVTQICDTREWTKKELKKLGFDFPDSKTNFIFAKHNTMPAKQIFEKLKEKKIFVRYFGKPGIDNYLRITMGTREQMERVIEELTKIL